MTSTPKTQTWNGTPVEYLEYAVTAGNGINLTYQGITLIPCIDYLWPDGHLRYVAIQDGEIIAVQTDYNGFCNMIVDSPWRERKQGSMRLIPPAYVRKDGKMVYEVPFVRATQEVK